MFRIPSHLHLTQYGIYHFRLAVPRELRCLLGKSEIKQTLKTGVRSEALHRSLELRSEACILFKQLKEKLMLRKISKSFDLSVQENRIKIIEYEYKNLFQLIVIRSSKYGLLQKETVLNGDDFAKALVDIYKLPSAPEMFALVVKAHGLKIEVNSFIGNILKHEVDAMYPRLVKDLQKYFADKAQTFSPPRLNAFSDEQADLIQSDLKPSKIKSISHASQAVEVQPPASSIVLSELIERFLSEKERELTWVANTKNEYESIFALILEILTDIPVVSIGHKQANDFKDILLKLPKNKDKSPLYRSKSIAEVIAMKIKPSEVMAVKTINKKLGLVSALFLWAKRHGHTKGNYFEGLSLKDKKKASDKREVFDSCDLKKLFSSPIYKGPIQKKAYKYWLPLIGLHTGARLEEICQLYLEDIRQEAGVWLFDINNKKDKRIKNNSSARLIPVHPNLIELGFLDYVDSLRNKKAERVFSELNRQQNKYGHYASRWFGTYRKKCGVTGGGKVFHSFRHTVINCFKQKGVARERAEAVTGHADKSISYGLYGKGYDVSALVRVIAVLDFEKELKDVSPWKSKV